jgi:septum site-determining protein MinC
MAVDSDAAEEVDRADKSVNDEETARMEVPVSVSPSVEPPVEPPVEPQESNTLQNLESDSQTPAFPAIYIHNESVRSGQQVSPPHRGQSLLILGSVNSGAEVLADADIVVLGKLRGRALAGLGEANNSAKIVAHGFQPELIGIGTVVTTDLEFPWLGQAATVQIDPHDATRLWIQPIATL